MLRYPPVPVLLQSSSTRKPELIEEICWNTISSPCNNQLKEKLHQNQMRNKNCAYLPFIQNFGSMGPI
jgi:hypothetical protein